MLRLSADVTESDVDLRMINGDESALPRDIVHGASLLDFAEAFVSRDEKALAGARERLLAEAGPAVVVDTAGVAANFQRMVRIADATGIPLDDTSAVLNYPIIKQLDLERFKSAENTPSGGLKRRVLSWIAAPLARRTLKKAIRKNASH